MSLPELHLWIIRLKIKCNYFQMFCFTLFLVKWLQPWAILLHFTSKWVVGIATWPLKGSWTIYMDNVNSLPMRRNTMMHEKADMYTVRGGNSIPHSLKLYLPWEMLLGIEYYIMSFSCLVLPILYHLMQR